MEQMGYTGWCFGTFFTVFSHSVRKFIIPIDELMFFRGVAQPPTRWYTSTFKYLFIIFWLWNPKMWKRIWHENRDRFFCVTLNLEHDVWWSTDYAQVKMKHLSLASIKTYWPLPSTVEPLSYEKTDRPGPKGLGQEGLPPPSWLQLAWQLTRMTEK